MAGAVNWRTVNMGMNLHLKIQLLNQLEAVTALEVDNAANAEELRNVRTNYAKRGYNMATKKTVSLSVGRGERAKAALKRWKC